MDIAASTHVNSIPCAGLAFDSLAETYDDTFTDTLIGRAQRDAVWRVLQDTFSASASILELNCGTGEDAIFLAKRGNSVFACDASEQMIDKAEQRLGDGSSRLPIVFCQLPTEHVGELRPEPRFDGVFSNFSGLNCIEDLTSVASSLATLMSDDGRMILCFSTRFCLFEMVYYMFRGQWNKAFRRCRGRTLATVGGTQFPVYYPTLGQIRERFAPYFRLCSYIGVGVAVPPTYCEGWVRRHRRIFSVLLKAEAMLAKVPILRVTGDHVLLCFEKVSR